MTCLCIDIGTSNCRAALVSEKGRVRSIARQPMDAIDGTAPYAEIDCSRAWQLVKAAVGRLLADTPRTDINAVGISSMLGYVLLDKDHQPIGPSILYADNRAVRQVDDMLRRVPGHEIHRITGRRATPELLAPKLLWLKAHQPGRYARIHTVIGLKDDMVRRLTGVVSTDVAHANYSLLYNVAAGQYDRNLIKDVGLGAGKLLPEPYFCDHIIGTVTAAAGRELGLKAGTPVISGSSDGTTAMYGGGLHQDNTAVLVSGSTDVLMVLSRQYPRDPTMSLSINTGPDASTFLVGGATGYSGAALRRFELLLNRSFDSVAPHLDQVPPGSNGLIVLPGLGGERAPYWKSAATGALCGLTMTHEAKHIFKALIEAMSYRIRKILRTLSDAGLATEAVRVVGGLGGNRIINQVRADVAAVPMHSLHELESTCVGTAVFCTSGLHGGGSALEISRSWSPPVETIDPDPDNTAVYEQLAADFEALMHTF